MNVKYENIIVSEIPSTVKNIIVFDYHNVTDVDTTKSIELFNKYSKIGYAVIILSYVGINGNIHKSFISNLGDLYKSINMVYLVFTKTRTSTSTFWDKGDVINMLFKKYVNSNIIFVDDKIDNIYSVYIKNISFIMNHKLILLQYLRESIINKFNKLILKKRINKDIRLKSFIDGWKKILNSNVNMDYTYKNIQSFINDTNNKLKKSNINILIIFDWSHIDKYIIYMKNNIKYIDISGGSNVYMYEKYLYNKNMYIVLGE
jgi:hypothetical protein